MAHRRRFPGVLAMLMFALMAQAAMARQAPRPEIDRGDQTLSPYFLVSSPDAALDSLPLKSTSAHVNISGVIADVTVTQVYGNQGSKPLEAIYVFPASTRAAVHGMKMTIGERVVEAKIRKREEARQEYEAARDAGKNASLLEQQRPNVFQMNVANIMPGDEVKVELRYTELIVPTDQVYEFMYPTVVGPRYVNKTAADVPASEHWTKNPYLHQGEPPTYAFDMKVLLAAGMPISEVTCPSHKVDTVFSGSSTAGITLDASEKHGGNRDFVLRYRLDGAKIQSGLLLFEGEKENFFLLMMQPPKRVTTADIPGREYVFIVDVSGSMHGFPLDVSKKLLRDLIGKLRASDRFNVILFAGASSVMAERSVSATEANIARAIAFIDAQQGGGGTELLPALSRALALPREDGVSRTLVIATDGYVSVEAEAFDLIRKRLGESGNDENGNTIPDIAWFGPDGKAPGWDDPNARTLCYMLDGSEDGVSEEPYLLYMILNSNPNLVHARLPSLPAGQAWRRIIDTSFDKAPIALAKSEQVLLNPQDVYLVNGRTVVLLAA